MTPSPSAASHKNSSPLQIATVQALLGHVRAVSEAFLSLFDRYQQSSRAAYT